MQDIWGKANVVKNNWLKQIKNYMTIYIFYEVQLACMRFALCLNRILLCNYMCAEELIIWKILIYGPILIIHSTRNIKVAFHYTPKLLFFFLKKLF